MWYVLYSSVQGDTMRIFYSIIIALLLSLSTAGFSSAQMTDGCCQDERAESVMHMTTCQCAYAAISETANKAIPADVTEDMPGGVDCCTPAACRGALLPSKVALCSSVSPVVFLALVQTASFYQPMPATLLGAHRTGLPPPPLQFPPVYIQHCSLLI
jgi:hypothetical protein